MRGAALTSVVVHGLALAMLASMFERRTDPIHIRHDHVPPRRALPAPRMLKDPESIQIELVTFAADPVLAPPTPEPRRGFVPHVVTAADLVIGRAAIGVTIEPHARADTWLRMRGSEISPPVGAPRIGDVLERIAAAPGHEAQRSEVVAAGGLRVSHGEDSVIHDEVTNLTVHADGTVAFHDKADIDIHLGLPILTPAMWRKMKQELGASLSNWYADPYAQTHVDGDTDDTDDAAIVPSPLPVIFGKVDITAWAMRKAGMDPYASRKLALLDRTRDERVARGLVYRDHQLDNVAKLMRRNLDELWTATADAAQRRAQLFGLWDECGESQDAEVGGKLGDAGMRARNEIIHWIRTRLPAGSAAAFSDAEVASLNSRRSSKQMFVPYASE